ncbi:MAG: HU family DNA-binding protein [Actinobacteria bacterium]|nr:HU family DNA-binding protein [Actinomycetota bacterium]MCL6104778.1 HU family DNA-binding protein [Actinomycetota bacterium]
MNKSQLVNEISKAAGITKEQAERSVNAFTRTVIADVKSGGKTMLIGFGSFIPSKRSARTGRNPQTGAPLRIPASRGVRFVAGSLFKDVVNGKAPLPALKASPAAKKAAPKKAVAKKAAPKKAAPKKAVAKKTVAKKAALVKKPTAKKTVAKKAPAKKAAPKKTAKKR